MSGEAGYEQRMLARSRSPRKDRQIIECEWIQTLIALEIIGYFYTLRLLQIIINHHVKYYYTSQANIGNASLMRMEVLSFSLKISGAGHRIIFF